MMPEPGIVSSQAIAQLVRGTARDRTQAVLSAKGAGDLISSVVVSLLWTAPGPQVATAYSTILFAIGGWLVWRVARRTATCKAGGPERSKTGCSPIQACVT